MKRGKVGDTYLPRLKKHKEFVAELYFEEDYSHLLGHRCDRSWPITATWLSNLPDHLLSRILSFRSPKEAAQTSILSKRWRHLWQFMPNFSIPLAGSSVKEITVALKRIKSSNVGLVQLKAGSISGKLPTKQKLESWLSLACSHYVEELEMVLDFYSSMPPPRHSYSRNEHWFSRAVSPGFATVKRLTLGFCMIDPIAAKSLTSLKYLHLDKVLLNDNMIEELTSSCPMLGELKLEMCNSNVPLRMRITNPKMTKLVIADTTIGMPNHSVLQLWAPYLSTLAIAEEVGRCYELDVPSLSTLKIVRLHGMSIYPLMHSLSEILSGIGTIELLLCSRVLFDLGREFCESSMKLASAQTMSSKVKRLHLQIKNVIEELPGLVYFLKSTKGIETLILDFENIEIYGRQIDLSKHLEYLDCIAFSRGKKKLVCLDDKNFWSSLRYILSHEMPDLKSIMINGVKRIINEVDRKGYYRGDIVSKYEFNLVELLVNYSSPLENMTIKGKKYYLIDKLDHHVGTETRRNQCKNVLVDDYTDSQEILIWQNTLLSLPKGSLGAKINFI